MNHQSRMHAYGLGLCLSALCLLMLTGCATLPRETKLECEAFEALFARNMQSQPIFRQQDGNCQEVPAMKVDKLAPGEVFTDANCSQPIFYQGLSFVDFCKNQMLGDAESKNFIGNPDAWEALDPTAPVKERPWTRSHAATLHLIALDQTQGQQRPFVKEVEYRREGNCALGMRIFKKDPSATGLKPAMFIHGGGWRLRGFGAVVGIGTASPNFTDRDFVLFAPFHRLIDQSDGPAACHGANGKKAVSDIEAALEWVFDNGERFGVDSDWINRRKTVVMGQSSGGHLTSWLVTHKPDNVERAIAMYPAADLEFMVKNLKQGGIYEGKFEAGGKLLVEFFDQPGVTEAIDLDPTDPFVIENGFPKIINPDPSGFPPMDIVHGDSDTIVPVEMSIRQRAAYDPATSPPTQLYPGGDSNISCGTGELTVVAGANHILDVRCLTGDLAQLISRFYPALAELCPSGSEAGETKVREALVAAYGRLPAN